MEQVIAPQNAFKGLPAAQTVVSLAQDLRKSDFEEAR